MRARPGWIARDKTEKAWRDSALARTDEGLRGEFLKQCPLAAQAAEEEVKPSQQGHAPPVR